MSDIAIRIDGLSKQYHIGGPAAVYDRLGEQLAHTLAAPFRRAGKLLTGKAHGAADTDETIWALNDITLDIKFGEVVGVIGRNAAGKSTLLKVLSRITEPTRGYADIYGRVGSLLEVGTGFHPELTGRENIFLNGAILGMRKSEITRKFDEIVSFAEIGKFIDTPVKHYSSGMYVRLAFAVAAHLEPEILLVDEVLAVGDVAFQNKCLGKMDDVAKEGRTVVFVSHNMSLLQTLCERGVMLENGAVVADGKIMDVVDVYLKSLEHSKETELSIRQDRKGEGLVRLTGVEICGPESGATTALKTGQPARFLFHVDGHVAGLHLNFMIYDHLGLPVTRFSSKTRSDQDKVDSNLGTDFVCEVDELLLLPGRYRVDVTVNGDHRVQDYIEAATTIDVADGFVDGRPAPAHKKFRVTMPHHWTLPSRS